MPVESIQISIAGEKGAFASNSDELKIVNPAGLEEIFERFRHQVDIVIDGGYGNLVASTIVNATNDDFDVVRQGVGEVDWL